MAAFLELQKVPGESQDDQHNDWIEILSWSWSMEQARLLARPNRSGPSQPEFSAFVFEHLLDKASTGLMKKAATGERIDKAMLSFVTDDDERRVEYLTIELGGVTVASVELSGDTGRPVESVALNYEVLKVIYSLIGEDGKVSKAGEFNWDVRTGEPTR